MSRCTNLDKEKSAGWLFINNQPAQIICFTHENKWALYTYATVKNWACMLKTVSDSEVCSAATKAKDYSVIKNDFGLPQIGQT